MTVEELIYEELISTGKAEVHAEFAEPLASEVMARYASVLASKNYGMYGRMLNIFLNDPYFSRLENVIFMVRQLENVKQGMYPGEAYSRILLKMKEQPHNKLLHYLWTQFRVRQYTREAYSEEMAFFLHDVFTHYPHLVRLDNFFQKNAGFFPGIEEIKKYARLLLPIFMEATSAFPGKLILHYYNLLCFSYTQDHEKAYYIYKYLFKKQKYFLRSFLEINNDHYTWKTFSSAVYTVVRNFELRGEFSQMLEVIDEVIKVYFRDEQSISKKDPRKPMTHTYFNLVFWRMRANMLMGKWKEVKFDHARIAQGISKDPRFWNDSFGDVLDYIRNHET